jgi:pyridoxamine 5'-phosphate oxidase
MSNIHEIEGLRKKYSLIELNEKTVSKDPFEQFDIWFKDALNSRLPEPNAMIISTVNRTGIPSVRTVLLKSYDNRGFVFFTNYESKKGRDLGENPNTAILFLWKEIGRQVRISGSVVKTMQNESELYFRSRPIESRLGAWASKQSSVLPSRENLIENYEKFRKQFEGKEIPLPPHWGGFRVIPEEFEFWQGRENRLHDRICYIIKGKDWHISRLSP